MTASVQIVEKPDWVTWEDIRQCLYDAHIVNREKGISMARYQRPSEEIKKFVGDNGTVLVALDGKKVVGTATVIERNKETWYVHGRYAYLGLAGVIPSFHNKGIYRELTKRRELIAEKMGLRVLLFDTHHLNTRIQETAKRNGYRYVAYTHPNNHYNVVMAKWLDGCPSSSFYCMLRFYWSKLKLITYINLYKLKAFMLER
jgi:GNAT superfamily N-acetyltransferase